MSVLKNLLESAVSVDASDIHITPNQPPFFRTRGKLTESGSESFTPQAIDEIVGDILPDYLVKSFEDRHRADFSLFEDGIGRFRVNVFLSCGVPSIAMRHVKTRIPTFEELRLPLQLKELAQIQRGIILLAGTTGCGKSSTLAAIVGEINRTRQQRIITVEDPVEYVFANDRSVITQREVGLDTPNYEDALKDLLRQDPDVILIGEMRDDISIRTALTAAETGHLVLSTLHAATANLAIPRLLNVFPADQQEQVRMALAGNEFIIICQRLIPDTHGVLVPAVEIMINTPTVRKLL